MATAGIKDYNQHIILTENTRKFIFIAASLVCISPFMSPSLGLLLGLILAQLMKNPFERLNHKATNLLLKTAVVGLGFGMNVFSAMQAGRQGILFTVAS